MCVLIYLDHWRHVWHDTALTEGGRQKCSKYWPELQKMQIYGDLEVLRGFVFNISPP